MPQGFEVHYQSQVTLDIRTITEMETLVRWGHPRRDLVMLSEFIQVTEETDLIVSIGERVLEETCRQATEWGNQNGHSTTITMCLNFSMRQLQDPDLADKVERALRRASLDANKLMLEITETMVIEDEQHVIGVLQELSALVVRIALDDFGSGYSSLNYVKDLPVDDAIVRLSVDLAYTLGLEVTAEGVENDRQVASLTAIRCDLALGYLFLETATQRGSAAARGDEPFVDGAWITTGQ